MSDEFVGFPKMARLSRPCHITEKIDGTNASVIIDDLGVVRAGSRNRYITPEDDNYGFASWVKRNEEELRKLGPGRHFGEWWGVGIGRKYDMDHRRFSLFNTQRWASQLNATTQGNVVVDPFDTKCIQCPVCHVVPLLVDCEKFSTESAEGAITYLEWYGSPAARAAGVVYKNPEGIVVYHIAGNIGFKKTLGNDGNKGKV